MTDGLPLEGLRVLDFTHMWSGPMLTRICASLGAEVLKVEAPDRADPMRFKGVRDIASRYPDMDLGEDPHNRNAWFNTQNVDKLGIVIDAKAPRGKQIIDELIRKCDVVVANFRAGVLKKMGFDYETLCSLRPDIILVEMTGYPSDSPLANLKAYGAQFESMSGAAALMGDEHGPLPTGFAVGDPIGGMYGVSALMAALHRRDRTGKGCHLEVPQSVTMMALMGDIFHGLAHGEPTSSALNDVPHACPHGIFAQHNEWLSISVFDETAWMELARLLEANGIEVKAHWADLAGRRQDRTAVNAAVQRWVDSQSDAQSATLALQAHGIASAPVATAEHIATSPQLREVSFYRELNHPSAGRHAYPGLPVLLGRDPKRVSARSAAPCFGQDTAHVLRTLLGISDDELNQLKADHIIVDAAGSLE